MVLDFIEISRWKMERDDRYRRRINRKIARRAGLAVMRKVWAILKGTILTVGDDLNVEYCLKVGGND